MSDRRGANGQETRSGGWKQDPERVRRDILRVAREAFARSGFSGARVDEIASRTQTSKRMIYYYFGDKTGLYQAVLEDAYRDIREGEGKLQIDALPAKEAMVRLVEFTFDHHRRNRDVVRLVAIENIHDGRHLEGSEQIRALNRPTLTRIEEIYRRGVGEGVFRPGLDALEIHWMISALSFFNVSNQTTFSIVFGDRLSRPGGQRRLKQDVVEAVTRFLANT